MHFGIKFPRIFYGWWIVLACFMIALYTAGAIGYSFTAFFEPIAREFGWSYTDISIASSLRGVEAGLFAPFVGLLIDRFGPRPVLFVGSIITGIGLFLFSRITSLPMFYVSFAVMAIGLSACSPISMLAAVSNWFRRRVSLTMGIMIAGWGFSGFMVPVVVRMVDTLGWRRSVDILAVGIFVLVLPLSLLVRRRPEQYGLLPDGDTIRSTASSGSGGHNASDMEEVENISGRQALKSRAFWHIAVALSMQHLLASAVMTHVMPYLSSVGIARTVSSLVATSIPISSIFGRFGFGWLGDKVKKKYITAFGFVLMGVGVLLFSYASSRAIWLLVPFSLVYGIGFGGTNTMRAVLPREYFGARNFATIFGFISGVGTVGSMVGAPLAGWVYDSLGSYRPIWFAFIGLAVFCLFTIVSIPPVKIVRNASPPGVQKDAAAAVLKEGKG
ncbi:MAG: MFS transporter [Chloroflexota bacterium]